MDEIKKNPALAVGALYVLGVLVTAVHLSRFAIYDLDLTKVRYIFAGAVFCYFIALRIIITAFILDFRIIISTQDTASKAIYDNLKDTRVFKLVDKVATHRYLQKVLWKTSSEQVASTLIDGLYRAAFIFIFSVFFFFLSIPKLTITGEQILTAILGNFPFYLGALIAVQIIYLCYFYFKKAMQTTEQLKYIWRAVLVLLLVTDVGVYAFIVHPLLKPVFGGGVVSIVRLIPKDQASSELIKQATGIEFNTGKSDNVFIVHTSDSAYYVTKQYDLNYLSPDENKMIRHGQVYRIQNELISGYEIIGFK